MVIHKRVLLSISKQSGLREQGSLIQQAVAQAWQGQNTATRHTAGDAVKAGVSPASTIALCKSEKNQPDTTSHPAAQFFSHLSCSSTLSWYHSSPFRLSSDWELEVGTWLGENGGSEQCRSLVPISYDRIEGPCSALHYGSPYLIILWVPIPSNYTVRPLYCFGL